MKRRVFLAALTSVSATGASSAAVFASTGDLLQVPMASLGKRFTTNEGRILTLIGVKRVGDTRLQQWHLQFSRDAELPEGTYSLRREDGARCELFLQSTAKTSTAQLCRFA